ncbi:MAG TPA: SPOR domain-containing protein [Candidatus Sulfotelmatobacter sp.]|nr:SPOR domain-containing protein [Candidatus Sulfotelmatobacter sp.]
MTSSEDTEITLGTGKLLVLFFVLVAICAGSFSLGYKLGSKSEPAFTTAAVSMPATSGGTKPAGNPTSAPAATSKPVEKSVPPDATAPTADAKPVTPADSSNPASSASNPSANPSASATPASNASDPSTMLPTSPYFVQVAAVSKQEDADALVDALKKKEYPAFVAASAAADKLFRIQVGPFPDIKDAEATRTRLIGDGYNPIVKK